MSTPAMSTMPTVLKKRSLADMQTTDRSLPEEFNEQDYAREVLQLDDDDTENAMDEALAHAAAGLGIEVAQLTTQQKAHFSCDSTVTVGSQHARTGSSGSQFSESTTATSRSSDEHLENGASPISHKSSNRRSLSFSEYDKLVVQMETQHSTNGMSLPIPGEPAPSLFSVSTRKSYSSIKSNLKNKFRLRRNKPSMENLNSCVCCRDDFTQNGALHTLACQHKYCEKCLRVLIQQSSSDESRMPPKCCNKALPAAVIKAVLTADQQDLFIKHVVQFSTPWEERIFCPNTACGEFIPKPRKIDPKHPFEVMCRKCSTKACSICKHEAHKVGQDCPSDWELDAVLQMGENQGWRRCYKCRTLVELTQGCSHITCRCKAQFCYICGAVWDPTVGCPNYCSGEEELERRRLEEEARAVADTVEKAERQAADAANATELLDAAARTKESDELNSLHAKHIEERDRFLGFERKMKWLMWTRHGQLKLDALEKYGDLQLKMRERHIKTANHLEDRQVAAEMELRASQKQSERSVRIRLRHMEAYCDGLGRPSTGTNPARVVTERDLRELGQQYNIRDDLDRLHQSKINVMRDKQAKQMEQLLIRQDEEVEKLADQQNKELDQLDVVFSLEEQQFLNLCIDRKARMRRRWKVANDVARKELEKANGLTYGPLEDIDWPDPEMKHDGLEAVTE